MAIAKPGKLRRDVGLTEGSFRIRAIVVPEPFIRRSETTQDQNLSHEAFPGFHRDPSQQRFANPALGRVVDVDRTSILATHTVVRCAGMSEKVDTQKVAQGYSTGIENHSNGFGPCVVRRIGADEPLMNLGHPAQWLKDRLGAPMAASSKPDAVHFNTTLLDLREISFVPQNHTALESGSTRTPSPVGLSVRGPAPRIS